MFPLRHISNSKYTATILACLVMSAAHAQSPVPSYPSKTTRIVVGVSPGSAADIPARAIGQKLGEVFGQQFLIDNRPGAGGNIAAEFVAKSMPDGHTMLLGSIANAINTALYSKLPFDFNRDFAPVILVASAANLLVVHPSLPAHDVAGLIKLAKAQPGNLAYASVGTGTLPHLAGELFKSMAKIDIVHIPYKGGPQATTDLIGGQFPFMFGLSANVMPYVATGRLRSLAISTSSRTAWLPDMPTVAESGLPGFEAITWWGFLFPANTPRAIVTRINAEVVKALLHPEVRQHFSSQRIDGAGGTPEQFSEHIRRETGKWGAIIKETGARLD